ncbi:DUF488 family protein, N3 subclade [Anabaena azotica]|uniref:DUF488 domain-containing protein n=1 Tax=Anabaena azotica FACHB-119 TaxID=947527 RepID=A0ABR8D9P5_9NOST|nr:hypothetical protein [Anabaena azotica]MBD2503912.1 hypothetical protein [Anabaena azotica FACHB-119]
MIYTSYYGSKKAIGRKISISLYPPNGWEGEHLTLFAPTPNLLKWWKSSAKDKEAEEEYKSKFREILHSRKVLIKAWIEAQKESPTDMTFFCFEAKGLCHRHQVGEEIILKYLPEMWGGEISIAPEYRVPATYPREIMQMIQRCHQTGHQVICDRIPCGYYQISLNGQHLGVWSELGTKQILSQLNHDFYQKRIIATTAANQ